MYNGTFYQLQTRAEGWDTQERGVQVFKQFDGELYRVNSCPATYTSCKPIRGTWPGLE
ncbi:MAG: hypothetical protein IKX59_05380 [Bacteroidales bacterium]|nr:hypothetical protein [Bacteroidales bacterium]